MRKFNFPSFDKKKVKDRGQKEKKTKFKQNCQMFGSPMNLTRPAIWPTRNFHDTTFVHNSGKQQQKKSEKTGTI